MPAIVDRTTAEHYVWGGGCDGWRHLSGQDLSVIHERMPPGTAEALHRHARARQLFFALRGGLRIEVDGELHDLAPEQSLEIPPNEAHRVLNPGPEDAWFLVVSSPTTRGDREDL